MKPITRWSSSLQGHTDAVLCAQFSPDGQYCASGSGDSTIRFKKIFRFWDILTETPLMTIEAHKHWVLCMSFSPNNKFLISGDSNGHLALFNVEDQT